MFPYDSALLVAVQKVPQSVADVLQTLQTIDATCENGDGLKWFNWLYLQVTQAVETRIASGGFADPAWLAELDVQFARLYFLAATSALSNDSSSSNSNSGKSSSGNSAVDCWQVLFERRDQVSIARIQFALAGINAHINHDLAEAIVATCEAAGTTPKRGGTQYVDYTALNTTLDGIVESAKQTLRVRLLGAALPPLSRLEDTIAAWSVRAARESAWNNAAVLWHLRAVPELCAAFMRSLDGLTAVGSKALLVPVP